jgi:NADH:ubiquinone oxidoreductase subunit E
MDVEAIDDILHKHEHRRSNIIAILQDLQARENYLREEALRYISGRLELSLARSTRHSASCPGESTR